MINIRFKIGSIVIALIAAYFLVNYASAQAIQNPTTVIDISTQTGIVGSFLRSTNDIDDCLNSIGVSDCFITELLVLNPDYDNLPDGILTLNNVFVTSGGAIYNYTTDGVGVEFNFNQTGQLNFDGTINNFVTGDLEPFLISWFYSYENGNPSISLTDLNNPPAPPNGSIWGTGNGIWGSTQVQDVSDTLTASVQETGLNLWPLLVFVGIVIAFVIFSQVALLPDRGFDKKAQKLKKELKKTEDKEKELENFYSKTGNADPVIVETIKRKRGRPRKQLQNENTNTI